MDPIVIALLTVTALLAGTVDAIAGGGGLITLPALLAAGLPPHLALGTNKGQSVWGSGAALVAFWRAGKVDRGHAWWTFLLGLGGSLGGAQLVLWISPQALRPIVIGMLIGAAVLLIVRKPHREQDAEHGHPWIVAILAAAIGCYDGFFGPGTGSFFVFLFVRWLGYDFLHASASAKLLNTATNAAALLLLGLKGHVWWQVAALLAVANVVGSLIGTRLALRHGAGFVRVAFIAVVAALIAKTGWDAFVR